MAVMLPPEASKLLNELGYDWPEGNEDIIFSTAGKWINYGEQVCSSNADAQNVIASVLGNNESTGIQAFAGDVHKFEGLSDVSNRLGVAGNVMGGLLYVIGGLVITLKITFVVNLVATLAQIASAIAAAVPTAGASMAWVPVAKILCKEVLSMAINLAISKIMGG